jgi:ubiquinone/menaquinone biosynthesis C-methylase UbiE
VVDLGSGAGGDVLRAAGQVGAHGRAIGLDMTPEMVSKARENARRGGAANAEFHLGEIEHIPLADRSADVVISNCVINLAPDKADVFAEAFRILRPGGRLIVSDMVSSEQLPESIRANPAAWAACISGAAEVNEYLALIRGVGFEHVETVASTSASPGQVFSVTVRAVKPSA